MRLTIDESADALYLVLSEEPAQRSEEVAPGIVLEYDDAGRVVGLEMLYLSRRAPTLDPRRLLYETLPAGR